MLTSESELFLMYLLTMARNSSTPSLPSGALTEVGVELGHVHQKLEGLGFPTDDRAAITKSKPGMKTCNPGSFMLLVEISKGEWTPPYLVLWGSSRDRQPMTRAKCTLARHSAAERIFDSPADRTVCHIFRPNHRQKSSSRPNFGVRQG